MKSRRLASLAAVVALAALPSICQASATITIVNVNDPGEGFNDPTPAAPIGGNAGTTVGAQRLNAFQYAASVWGSKLDSNVAITIQASFEPLSCNATTATLGAAGAIQIFGNFPNAEFQDTWYHVALANKLAGEDLAPGPPGSDGDDIVAFFNSNLGKPGCLTGSGWYYGFDTANPPTLINLVTVLLHEFSHGLGFANFVTEASGSQPLNLTDVYSQYTLDTLTGLHWSELTTNAQRAASAINSRRVVWDGLQTFRAVPSVLAPGTPILRLTSPGGIAGVYPVGTASFGPVLASPGVTGQVALAFDAANASGPTTTDACTAITNAAEVAGRIALVDRGTCGFVVKVKNAQNAGSIAVLVADNAAGGPPAGLGGADPTITIPSARITLADGNLIKANLAAGVNANLGVDNTIRSGADSGGRPHLWAPNPVQPGSSISHWDSIAFPNQLMEPAINADLTHSIQPPQDLTLSLLTDIGWFSDNDGVPDGRDACLGTPRTVVIQGCDSGSRNPVDATGCNSLSEVIYNSCAVGAKNHGQFVSCVNKVTSDYTGSGKITKRERDAIHSCAAHSTIGK